MNGNKRDNKILIILVIFTIIFTLLGVTFAYLNWQTSIAQRTYVTFTANANFTCSVDGGGNITNDDSITIIPSSCTNNQHVIKKVIKTDVAINGDEEINMDLWFDVESMGNYLLQSENFKYTISTEDSCTQGIISSGVFKNSIIDNKIILLSDLVYNTSKTDTYYLYIWLDKEETMIPPEDVSAREFNLSLGGDCSDESLPSVPVIEDTGMIPVKISNNGEVRTVLQTDSSWYDYDEKMWANAILVKENGINTRNYYQNNSGVMVEEDDILAYLVWIPRYKYQIWTTGVSSTGNEQSINIVFENKDVAKSSGTSVGEYLTHPAFTFGSEELNGIWVGKFETSHSTLAASTTSNSLGCTDEGCSNANGLIIKPNVNALRYQNVSNMFYATRSMEQSGNFFGISGENVDSHMMKNSEWGAVAYLSHSVYGINGKVYGNNYYDNGNTKTGCGTTLQAPTSSSTCEIVYGEADEYLQSTTGNISGIFDMTGGVYDIVMGNYNGITISSNDFTIFPNLKYWDKYTITDVSSCTTVMCGGHALSEVYDWYSRAYTFVSSSTPWFKRGRYYENAHSAGIFDYSGSSGNSGAYNGFRIVLVN